MVTTTNMARLLLALWLASCGSDEPPTPLPAPTDKPPTLRGPAIPNARLVVLDRKLAAKLARLPLECVGKPFPNKPSHVYTAADQLRPPQELTPAFYGCFDWHSAVHSHWSMIRLLRRFPNLDVAPALKEALAKSLTQENLAKELAFFQQKRARLFERPYGWAWLLRLSAELDTWKLPEARALAEAVKPLAAHIVAGTRDYLDRLSVPIRAGTHSNTAFAMAHMLDYAEAVGDAELAAYLKKRAGEFYADDSDCPTAYEPSGEDFISPCLSEADLMRRVMPAKDFPRWLDNFLPAPGSRELEPLTRPTEVRDPKDPRIGHLIGLFFHRAWCFGGLASALPRRDARQELFINLHHLHAGEGVRLMFASGYGGRHWLASFALLALSEMRL